jgi:hypothetical protein
VTKKKGKKNIQNKQSTLIDRSCYENVSEYPSLFKKFICKKKLEEPSI